MCKFIDIITVSMDYLTLLFPVNSISNFSWKKLEKNCSFPTIKIGKEGATKTKWPSEDCAPYSTSGNKQLFVWGLGARCEIFHTNPVNSGTEARRTSRFGTEHPQLSTVRISYHLTSWVIVHRYYSQSQASILTGSLKLTWLVLTLQFGRKI